MTPADNRTEDRVIGIVDRNLERYARLAQEPSLWDYEMQRDFNRDLHRSGRRDG